MLWHGELYNFEEVKVINNSEQNKEHVNILVHTWPLVMAKCCLALPTKLLRGLNV